MLKNLLLTFKSNRQLTYDMLDSLTNEQLYRKWNRPGLDSYAKHFAEMVCVLRAFTLAMKTGNMDFSQVPDVFEFKGTETKEELKNALLESEKELEDTINSIDLKKEIYWFDMYLPIEIHFVNIISHEVFHHGMMVMDIYSNHLKIPDSFINNWSLPESK